MAGNSVGRHIRSIRRAVIRLQRRQIKPGVAVQLIGRNTWRGMHALVVLLLFLVVAAIVLIVMASGSVVRKYRGDEDMTRGSK